MIPSTRDSLLEFIETSMNLMCAYVIVDPISEDYNYY